MVAFEIQSLEILWHINLEQARGINGNNLDR